LENFAMPTDWKRINRELAEKRENLWDALNTGSGGAYQLRVRTLLDEQREINRLDARIKTLSDEGWSDARIAQELGYQEKTIYSHCSKMRKIAGVDRKVPFRTLFLPP